MGQVGQTALGFCSSSCGSKAVWCMVVWGKRTGEARLQTSRAAEKAWDAAWDAACLGLPPPEGQPLPLCQRSRPPSPSCWAQPNTPPAAQLAGGRAGAHPHTLGVDGVPAAQHGGWVHALEQELEAYGAVLVHGALHALVVALEGQGVAGAAGVAVEVIVAPPNPAHTHTGWGGGRAGRWAGGLVDWREVRVW